VSAGVLACGLIALGMAAGSAAAEGVGVAPFEVVPAGQAAPDLGRLLADRLALRGLGRVVGPVELAAPARFEPTPAETQARARAAAVDAVVVGRVTKVGAGLSIDARWLDGATGKAFGKPVVAEAARSEDLGRAVDGLTGGLVERLGERPGAVSAAGPAAAAAPTAARPQAGAGVKFDRDKPLSIRSDELESEGEPGGRRRLVFRGHVRAVQGDLVLVADHLEAVAAAGETEPDRLTARGHVTIEQGARVARCAEAEYFRREERVVCTGQLAEIEQGCDRVRGPKIIFHLGSERLEVQGGADVQIRPEAPGCRGTAAAQAGGAKR
jgi:lipopolysaccharide transport protein LptA